MILFNIVSLVALASAILMLMLSQGASGLDRSLRFREASQAAVLARAGETSATVALRRDAAEAPESDHLREPWAKVIQRQAAIEGGTFTLTITDAQSRFNLNNLGQGAVLTPTAAAPIAAALQLDPALAERISAAIRQGGPLQSLSQLRDFGVDEATLTRLSPLITLLPQPTPVNLNTASEDLITLMLGNAAAARMLVAQRQRAGYLTGADLTSLGLFMPPGAGFTSSYYWVRTTVTIGDTPQTLTSLLSRSVRQGRPQVTTLGRWRGATAPDQALAP
nr:type II secretion system minor pseudopilin GspK [Pseudomonadota bacterium]